MKEEEQSIGKGQDVSDADQQTDWDQLERDAFRNLPFYDPFALFAEGMGRGIIARLRRERAEEEARLRGETAPTSDSELPQP